MSRTLAAVIGLTFFGACTNGDGADAQGAGPRCNEELLASGRGIPWAPGLALAVSYQIEATHPELGGIIDAAADFERAHPRYQDLEDPDYGNETFGDGAHSYLGTLLVLAEQPDLATPEIIGALEQAAREGGIPGVGNTVRQGRPGDPPPFDTEAFSELQSQVRERRQAVEDSDLVPLPHRPCQEVDEEGGESDLQRGGAELSSADDVAVPRGSIASSEGPGPP